MQSIFKVQELTNYEICHTMPSYGFTSKQYVARQKGKKKKKKQYQHHWKDLLTWLSPLCKPCTNWIKHNMQHLDSLDKTLPYVSNNTCYVDLLKKSVLPISKYKFIITSQDFKKELFLQSFQTKLLYIIELEIIVFRSFECLCFQVLFQFVPPRSEGDKELDGETSPAVSMERSSILFSRSSIRDPISSILVMIDCDIVWNLVCCNRIKQ